MSGTRAKTTRPQGERPASRGFFFGGLGRAATPFFSPLAPRVQRKLTVGEPNDGYEQEADRVADAVVAERAPAVAYGQEGNPAIRRQCAACEEQDTLLRKPPAASSGTSVLGGSAASHIASLGAGQPLSNRERAYFEPRFGRSFADVRLHRGQAAAERAGAIHARAYTLGNHIVMGQGQSSDGSQSARRLVAHELTHTVQQGHEGKSSQVPEIQRDEFEPWPGQTGHDVAGTRERSGDIIREQVQRLGDPTYSQLDPMLLELNTRTCQLTVRKELNFVRAGTGDRQLSEEAFRSLKARILAIANERLNGWVSINVAESDQCTLSCGGGTIGVNVVTAEGTGSYSTTISLHRTYGRENARNIGADASERTIWHEMGHVVLGAADEYAESRRPDGTRRPASRVNESDWSIMGSTAGTRRTMMHARHFSHLPAWLGRRFPDCRFSLNEASRPLVVEWSPSLFLGGFGSVGGSAGLYYSLGLDLGIPLDRLRRLEMILGARLSYIMELSEPMQQSLLLGFRAGLQGQFGSSGVRLGGFAEGGGVGFTDLATGGFGARPYFEGGLRLGYSFGGSFDLGVEAAAGGRELRVPEPIPGAGVSSEFLPYYRFGLTLGGSF
jgi:hypothetical protein